MMRQVRVFVPLLLLIAPALEAQQIPSPYRYIEPGLSAGVFAGYLSTERGEFGVGPHSAPLLGGSFTVRFAGPLSGEVSLGAAPTQRTVFQRVVITDDSAEVRSLGDTDALLLIGTAGLRFGITGSRTWNGFAPYVSGSAGLAADMLGESEMESAIEEAERFDFGPAFAVGLAAGTDWFLTERLALRLEARDHLWRLTIPQGLAGTLREEKQWTHNLTLTLGAALYF